MIKKSLKSILKNSKSSFKIFNQPKSFRKHQGTMNHDLLILRKNLKKVKQ